MPKRSVSHEGEGITKEITAAEWVLDIFQLVGRIKIHAAPLRVTPRYDLAVGWGLISGV